MTDLELEKLNKLFLECFQAGFCQEKDNFGQIVLYTGLKHDLNGRLAYMEAQDFDEEDDENDY